MVVEGSPHEFMAITHTHYKPAPCGKAAAWKPTVQKQTSKEACQTKVLPPSTIAIMMRLTGQRKIFEVRSCCWDPATQVTYRYGFVWSPEHLAEPGLHDWCRLATSSPRVLCHPKWYFFGGETGTEWFQTLPEHSELLWPEKDVGESWSPKYQEICTQEKEERKFKSSKQTEFKSSRVGISYSGEHRRGFLRFRDCKKTAQLPRDLIAGTQDMTALDHHRYWQWFVTIYHA